MAVLLAQLPGPINLRLVLSDTKFSDILHDLVTAKGNRSGVPRALAVDRNETRELAGTLHIEAPAVPVYSYSYSYSYSDNIIPTMTSATAPSGIASASSNYDIDRAEWKAFDHANAVGTDVWCSAWATGTEWLQYQLPSAHAVTRYAVTSAAGWTQYAPKSWTFKGSNDGATWDTLDTQTNVTAWSGSPERRIYDLTNSTAYAYYRLDITVGAPADADLVAVGELEMMETTETTETIVSYSSGKDSAIAQIRAINALVTVGTTLTLKSTGATYPVTLNILPSRGVSHPLDELFEIDGAGVLASCPFSFTCEPYAYGPLTTALNAEPFTAPCVVDCGTILGDYPAPLTVEFAFQTAVHVQRLWCGRLAPGSGLTASDLLPECEGGTWYNGVTGNLADATYAHNGSYRYNASTAYANRYFGDQYFDPGSYMLLTRARMENAADTGMLVVELAGKQLSNAVAAGTVTPRIYEMGVARLPNTRARAAEQSTLTFLMNSTSAVAAHSVMADYLGICPTSWGYFRIFQPFGTGVDLTWIRVEGGGAVYQNNIVNMAYYRGNPIVAVGGTRLAVFADVSTSAPTVNGTANVTYTPRYALWR
jgi:hypothetical protein